MSADTRPAKKNAAANAADKKSNAGSTPDPWEACATLEYGGDRSFAWSVREQVIASPPESRGRVEERLLKALALPSRTDAGGAFLCQMLALVGSAKSVPALATLLRDAKTADAARYALQQIPGGEADAALRDALPAMKGREKAGIVGTIGMRGDSGARTALTAIKDDAAETPLVREAAGRALERLTRNA